MDLSIAMITAPRSRRTVERSLRELRRGGFHQTIHLFQEPGADVAPCRGVVLHSNPRKLGVWKNWLQAARFLHASTTAEYLLICEDDIALCPAASEVLRQGLASVPARHLGALSLYTPQHNVTGWEIRPGWQAFSLARNTWGALAFCFSRQSLALLLATELFQRQRHRPAHTDNLVGAGCVAAGRSLFYHLPSLATHTGGDCSTVAHGNPPGFAAIGYDPQLARIPKPPSRSPRHLPLVTCLMPTANRPQFAAQAIRCFQRQTYPRRELVIVDDGESDLSSLVARDRRIKYVRLRPHVSIGQKRNLAAQAGGGDIFLQWDDDEWHGPERIARQVEPLRRGWADLTGLADTIFFELERWEFWRYGVAGFRRLYQGAIHGGTMAYKRHVWERITKYEDLNGEDDQVFLSQAVAGGATLLAIPARHDFLHLRHGRNTWAKAPPYQRHGGKLVEPPAWSDDDLLFYKEMRAAHAMHQIRSA